MTNLAKQALKIGFKGGNDLIRYAEDPDALRKVLSEGLYQAISLHSKETSEDAVKIMVADVIEDYASDPVSVIIKAITKIRKGHIKIFGKVTPTDLREMITAELEDLAAERLAEHNARKGFGDVDPAPRTSSRHSD